MLRIGVCWYFYSFLNFDKAIPGKTIPDNKIIDSSAWFFNVQILLAG